MQTSKWEVELKNDSSPLTRADREANRVICTELQRITPHIPIISEENKLLPYEARKVGSLHRRMQVWHGRRGSWARAALTGEMGPRLACELCLRWCAQGFQYFWLVDPLDGTKGEAWRCGRIPLVLNHSVTCEDSPRARLTVHAHGQGCWRARTTHPHHEPEWPALMHGLMQSS